MSKNNDIINAIRSIARSDDEVYSILCTVAFVDETNNTCDCVPVLEAPDLLGVKLMPLNDDGNLVNGFLMIPKLGSMVIVTMLNKQDGHITMFSEVEEIQLNGKNYDGLVKIGDLVTKLNNLENKVNSIISTFNSHTHPYVNVTTPSNTTPSSTPVVGTLTPTIQIDLENKTVLHGNGI